MAKIEGLAMAGFVFFFGVIFSVITYYIVPILLTTIQTATSNSDPTLEAAFWIGLISLWVILIVIAPGFIIVNSLKSKPE